MPDLTEAALAMAYSAGENACVGGWNRDSNPYQNDDLRSAWDSGFTDQYEIHTGIRLEGT